MNYNPYAFVPLLIDGKPIDGRPVEFDSDVANQKTMKNAFGAYVKPTKVVSVCPGCGQGLTISLKLPDPPFQPVPYSCSRCHPTPPMAVDPFVNPLESGRVPVAELDPLLHNPDKPLKQSGGLVEERFERPANVLPVAPATLETDLAPDMPAPADKPKKADTTPQDILRSLPLEPADEMTEEVDFDDSEMLDDE